MRSRLLGAVGCGSVALCFSQWFMETWGNGIVNVPSDMPSDWRVGLLVLLTSLAAVAPGVCAGLVSRTQGLLAGVLTGFAGSVLYSFVRFGLLVHYGTLHLTPHAWTLPFSFLSIFLLASLVYSAAGGAMGELLRSNNRWRSP